MKVTVLPVEAGSNETEAEPRHSTLGALLKHAGKWSGDDLEECLQDVYDNRTKAKFD